MFHLHISTNYKGGAWWHVVSDIPEDEARYWAKKLEQLNAMRDQDVSCNLFRLVLLERSNLKKWGNNYLIIISIYKTKGQV